MLSLNTLLLFWPVLFAPDAAAQTLRPAATHPLVAEALRPRK